MVCFDDFTSPNLVSQLNFIDFLRGKNMIEIRRILLRSFKTTSFLEYTILADSGFPVKL